MWVFLTDFTNDDFGLCLGRHLDWNKLLYDFLHLYDSVHWHLLCHRYNFF